MTGLTLTARKTAFALVLALAAMSLAAGPASAQTDQDCKRPAGGKVLSPKSISFEHDSSDISPEYRAMLDEMAQRFGGNPNIEVCLIGVTDRSGDADYNKKLAMKRAEVVADYLKQAGLAENKYQLVGRGQAYSDDSWIGKVLGDSPKKSNRRVDILFMER